MAYISTIDAAISISFNTTWGTYGHSSNRLDHSVIANLENISVNSHVKRSNCKTDFAEETANLGESQIMQQAATAMLAQANASKQNSPSVNTITIGISST